MTKKDILAIANKVCEGANSMKDINAKYNDLKAQYGMEEAKRIIDSAKEMRRKDMAKIDCQRDLVVDSIDGSRVLKAVFADLCKDREYKKLCWVATCKCKDVDELVAKWYPHTIDGQPARKLKLEDGSQIWTAKDVTRSNAASILVACIKNVAKACKHQKSGTTEHVEGEPVESK